MNNDVVCPYCGKRQKINHDDGYGYTEDEIHSQDCVHCDKSFYFTTIISCAYDVYCCDDEHDLVPYGERWPDMYECSKCNFYGKRS